MPQADRTELIDQFHEFYRNYYRNEIGELAQGYPKDQKSLYVDMDDLYRFSPELCDDYKDNPSQIREYAEEALRLYDMPIDVSLSDAHVRVLNHPDTTAIRDVRHDHHSELVSVRGIVRKATDVRPKMLMTAFECQRCGTMTRVPQRGEDFEEPHECQGCERQGPFRANIDESEFVDSQKLRVQESPEGLRGGETPQSIDVKLEDDVTGEITAGDEVTVTGTLKLQQTGNQQEKSTLYDPYIEGHSVVIEDEQFENVDITDDDLSELKALSNEDNIYEKMVSSLAPSIYGYEREKLALVLQLFSGVSKELPDGTSIRGDMHMLLIGDPGTGKSQLISYVNNIAPRSVYTSGKGASSAGLTASAVKDDFADGQQWSLEAGALVLADKGLAAVDEVDKMKSSDRSAMHQALEQQEVSISKAGINATLKSRCSLLGAANPKYGRFDKYEPISEQIDLEPALISRFDLIFTVTDTPDEEKDNQLADHILKTNLAGELNSQLDNVNSVSHSADDIDDISEDVVPPIDADILEKYIAYARQNVFPALTEEARDRIQDFYVDLRVEGQDEDSAVPVTARKLEALVRLAEASARVRLSNKATIEDAKRAVDIAEYCLKEVGVDPETGELDADIIEAGTSKSQRDRVFSVKNAIDDMEDEFEDDPGVPFDELIERCEEKGVSESEVEHEIEKLKQKGDVYEPRTDVLRTT